MKYAIIVQNDVSAWDDKTGERYNYPAKYKNLLLPGTKVIYYNGKLKNKLFESQRLSNEPHYFGVGIIGASRQDENASKKEFYCDILSYEQFDKAVPFKIGEEYLETIPKNKESNYWRDAVRPIDKETFDKIISLSGSEFEDQEIEVNAITISARKFDTTYNHFLDYVIHESGQPFIDFATGYVQHHESYKYELRDEALSILKVETWTKDQIGEGEILSKIIQILELPNNNLVDTRRRAGEGSEQHYDFISALNERSQCVQFESVLFDLFKSNKSGEVLFNELIGLIKHKYPIIAFLFFIKNDREFLPISPTNFEHAFRMVGCDLRLSHQCSWENYSLYLQVIHQVKDALESKLHQSVTLLDAHSFLWIIGYHNRLEVWLKDQKKKEDRIVFEEIQVVPFNDPNRQRKSRSTEGLSRAVNWEQREKQNRIAGRRAEEFAIEFEVERLKALNVENPELMVKDVSDQYHLGYDLETTNPDGTMRRIEVKSSNTNKFIITRNEYEKSQKHSDYWIYVVTIVNRRVKVKTIKNPNLKDENQFDLVPLNYEVTFENRG